MDSLQLGEQAMDNDASTFLFHDVAENISDFESIASDEVSLDNIEPVETSVSDVDALKYACPIHRLLYNAIQSSSFLSPLFVRVKNESYWYSMRSKLGPKKQNALLAKQNPNSMVWESSFYKMKTNEDFEMVPQKQFITSHSNRLAAYKRSEMAGKSRDENPADNKKIRKNIDCSKLLDSHFRILVVSARFYRTSNLERIGIIYEELLKALGRQCSPTFPLDPKSDFSIATAPPEKSKLASYYGKNTCQLPVLRFILPDNPLTLIVEARTPSQWKPDIYNPPDSERYGSSHVSFTALQVPRNMRPDALSTRVQKLAIDPHSLNATIEHLKLPTISRMGSQGSTASGYSLNSSMAGSSKLSMGTSNILSSSNPSMSISTSMSISNLPVMMAETLGMDPSVSGMKYKKMGGIFGHFFRDLDPKIREMIMERFKNNKRLIQKEGNVNHNLDKPKKKKDNNQPMTNLAKMRAKMEAKQAGVMADYDKGTATETEMLEEIFIQAKRIERVAIRLQRIRRITMFSRAAKLYWRRQYSALLLQKAIRGHYGRLYANLLRKLLPVAVVRIQIAFRAYRTRQTIKKWKLLSRRLTRVVLPKIKRFIRNCFRSWMRKNTRAAIVIQAMIRMHIVLVRYSRQQRYHAYMVVHIHKSAISIQRVIRGRWGRLRHARLYKELLSIIIDTPAALRIQRIQRGRRGRLLAKKRALMIRSANLLQQLARKFVRKVWDAQVAYHKLRKVSATHIQRISRGRIDRKRVVFKQQRWWYEHVYIPSIIKVQSIARGHFQRGEFKRMVLRMKAATRLQRYYRGYKKRLLALAKWLEMRRVWRNQLAARIQAMLRGYFARRAFYQRRMAVESKVTLAAKKILRAWYQYKASMRLTMLLDEHRLEVYWKKIKTIQLARQENSIDLVEIKQDIEFAAAVRARWKARLLEVDTFIIESAMRIPAIREEMLKFTQEDFERGWAEAFGNEYDSLNSQQAMAKEEVRLLKSKLLKQKRELVELYIEQEENLIEGDHLAVLEIEAYEGLRRAELQKIDRKVNMKWQRDLRMERCKWKIDCVRMTVIRRSRPGYQGIMKKARDASGRDLAYAQTINFEKRAQVVDKEEIVAEHLIKMDGLNSSKNLASYDKYAGPFQDTYDKVVGRTLSLLRDSTLDNRVELVKDQYKAKERAKKKLRGGQFAPLKDDYQLNKRAFDDIR